MIDEAYNDSLNGGFATPVEEGFYKIEYRLTTLTQPSSPGTNYARFSWGDFAFTQQVDGLDLEVGPSAGRWWTNGFKYQDVSNQGNTTDFFWWDTSEGIGWHVFCDTSDGLWNLEAILSKLITS